MDIQGSKIVHSYVDAGHRTQPRALDGRSRAADLGEAVAVFEPPANLAESVAVTGPGQRICASPQQRRSYHHRTPWPGESAIAGAPAT